MPFGFWFIWTNGKTSEVSVYERLDRTVVNQEWMSLSETTKVESLSVIVSDHSSLCTFSNIKMSFCPRSFKFELMWLVDDACNDVVTKTWNESVSRPVVLKLLSKLKLVNEKFEEMIKEVFGN